MTRFGHAQVLGFSEDVQKAIEKEGAILKANGTNPDVLRASVVTNRERTVALNAEQECAHPEGDLEDTPVREGAAPEVGVPIPSLEKWSVVTA